ncbi:MAG: outer membrane protein assembly factor YaeT precursor [Polyangiaceae bacterium]|nr:outer membrane protein assembly factor YaeT precursor [Polyangiaceae bacterium]
MLLLAGLALGCTRAPSQRFNLDSLKVTGNSQLDDAEIEERIASRETPRFLGLFPGVMYDYEVFNRFVLERDLQRIERFYRSRGYYEAHARAAHVYPKGNKVRVEIVVEEGRPVLLRRVDVHGLEKLPPELRADARSAVLSEMPLNEPLEEEKLDISSKALARMLGDNGYAQAVVQKSADVNLPKRTAAAGFWVTAGEPSELGEVTLQGLKDLPELKVRRALSLEPGMPYSQSDLDEAKRAALDLGVFASVDIEPQVDKATPGPNGKPRIPILVKLEKAKLRSIHVGGGALVDQLQTDLHLTFGWENQSFLGGMRKLQFTVQPGVVFYPTRFPTFQAPTKLLPKATFRTEFRQPGFITGRTNLVLRGQVRAGPVLWPGEPSEQVPIVGYFDNRVSAGLERTWRRLYTYLSHNVQVNVPFYYYKPPQSADCGQPPSQRPTDLNCDPTLGPVWASYPALMTNFDLRDDPIHPHKGVYLGNQIEVAGLGGDARDLKLQPEVRAYVPVSKRVTLASRVGIGLLFAQNYGKTVETNSLSRQPPAGTSTDEWIHDIQLMFMRGLFAGGSGSNRGYALREIGPHGTVPFYNYGQTTARCGAPDADPSVCALPLGGFTLWEASVELRFPLFGDLAGTLFVDAADVSARRLDFRLRPHLSAGFGFRYDTPVGPIRLDLGYRIPGLQAPANAQDERPPREGPFGLPIALSFGIGESY